MGKKKAIMYLPKGGKEAWTKIMEGSEDINPDIEPGDPIVMATATFENGIMVAAGVYKWKKPEEFNIKFYRVYGPNGNFVPYLIDPSDDEDFRESRRDFYLNDSEAGDLYILKIKERKEILTIEYSDEE